MPSSSAEQDMEIIRSKRATSAAAAAAGGPKNKYRKRSVSLLDCSSLRPADMWFRVLCLVSGLPLLVSVRVVSLFGDVSTH